MVKNLAKRSQFVFVQLSTLAVIKSLALEADEVYITQITPSTAAMQVRRQRERDMKAAMTNSGLAGLGGVSTQEWVNVDLTYGRISLDNPPTSDGKLMNRPVTTASNDLTQPERFSNANVGFKETVDFRSATEGQQATVMIELIHYVPAEVISA